MRRKNRIMGDRKSVSICCSVLVRVEMENLHSYMGRGRELRKQKEIPYRGKTWVIARESDEKSGKE